MSLSHGIARICAALGLVSLLGATACESCQTTLPGTTADLSGHEDNVQLVDESFEKLFTLFLWHSSMQDADRASLWTSYEGRWVRWEGVIASFNEHGVTLRHLLTTATFDVSLTCDRSAMKGIKQRFAVGDRVLYTGRLDSFDAIFRTLYLVHGVVIEKRAPADLGEPADLAHPAVK
jgi:hypothetical protein